MRFVFIPGLGADARVFEEYVKAFPDSVVLEWLPPTPTENLETYARRLARSVTPSPPCIVVGLSFGGMLAPYIAEELGAEYCVLLASAKSGRDFPRWYCTGRFLFRWCPWFVPMLIILAKFEVRILNWKDGSKWQSVCDQFVKSSTKQMFHFLRMMLDRAFESSHEVPERKTPILQVHGKKDRLIPIKNVQPDVVIPGGGHLFLLTHFDAVLPILQDLEKKLGG
ncbi:MAG: alpha/beta hydrolase [Thermoguttaceae bacterium]|nr:alpha/beta hydrolase [Thermoguttaceae bacterium]